jgi:hypothetical protein
MKYKITVEKLMDPPDGVEKRYGDTVEIYKQTVDDLDVPALVTWINNETNKQI